MYWPLGTPRIYATSSSRQPGSLRTVSHDGLPPTAPSWPEQRLDRNSLLSPNSAALHDGPSSSSSAPPHAAAPLTPVTPITPLTPGIKPVEHEHDYLNESSPALSSTPSPAIVPLHEPILALRTARSGHIFAVITATSMTIWQTRVRNVLVGSHCYAVALSNLRSSPPSSWLSLSGPKPPSRLMAPIPTCFSAQTRPSLSSIRAWDIS
jgi:RAB6A-GEF complex partner protein 1